MNLKQTPSVGALLARWARHECLGRLSSSEEVPATLRQQLQDPAIRTLIEEDAPVGRRIALQLLLQTRGSMIVNILEAEPTAVVEILLTPSDVGRLGYLEHGGFAETPLAPWAKEIAESGRVIEGPFIAVASNPAGKLQLIDGLHRARAWIERWSSGDVAPLPVSVVVTARPSWWERPY